MRRPGACTDHPSSPLASLPQTFPALVPTEEKHKPHCRGRSSMSLSFPRPRAWQPQKSRAGKTVNVTFIMEQLPGRCNEKVLLVEGLTPSSQAWLVWFFAGMPGFTAHCSVSLTPSSNRASWVASNSHLPEGPVGAETSLRPLPLPRCLQA